MKVLSASLLSILIVSGLIACKSEEDDFEDVSAKTADSMSVSAPVAPAAAPLPALPPPPIALPQPAATLSNQAGQRPLVNPAHGLPYHDCSIAVGAPLAEKGNVSQPVQPAFTPTLPQLQSPQGGVKVNPAHGKPGHRCEIAVGAPLP